VPYLGWGGWFGTVTKGCARPDAAWDFLAELGHPGTTSLEVIGAGKWGAGPFRVSHLEARNRSPWYGYGLPAGQTEKLVDQLRQNLALSVTNYRVRLRTPDQAAHAAALGEGLRSALEKGAEPKAALDGAAEKWRELAQQSPDHRKAYRLSLGLSAESSTGPGR
jgi:ABC-type glycerol-3-phosphate transport system substrate-binding protein